jgi:hypothetical protein
MEFGKKNYLVNGMELLFLSFFSSFLFFLLSFFLSLFLGNSKDNFLKERELTAVTSGGGGGGGEGKSGGSTSGDVEANDEQEFFEHLRKLDSGEIVESDNESIEAFGSSLEIDSDDDDDSDKDIADSDDEEEEDTKEGNQGKERNQRSLTKEERMLSLLLAEMESNLHQPYNVHELYKRFSYVYSVISPSLSSEQQEEMKEHVEKLRYATYDRSYDSLTSHRLPHQRLPNRLYPLSYYRDDLRVKGYRYYGDPEPSHNNDDSDDEGEGGGDGKVSLKSVVRRLVEMKDGNKKGGEMGRKLKEVLAEANQYQREDSSDSSDSDSDSNSSSGSSSSDSDDELEKVDEHDEDLLKEEGKDVIESDSKRLKAAMRSINDERNVTAAVGKEERNRDSDLEEGKEEGDLLEADPDRNDNDLYEDSDEETEENRIAKTLSSEEQEEFWKTKELEVEQQLRVDNLHFKKGLISIAPGDKKGTLGTEVKAFSYFSSFSSSLSLMLCRPLFLSSLHSHLKNVIS